MSCLEQQLSRLRLVLLTGKLFVIVGLGQLRVLFCSWFDARLQQCTCILFTVPLMRLVMMMCCKCYSRDKRLFIILCTYVIFFCLSSLFSMLMTSQARSCKILHWKPFWIVGIFMEWMDAIPVVLYMSKTQVNL